MWVGRCEAGDGKMMETHSPSSRNSLFPFPSISATALLETWNQSLSLGSLALVVGIVNVVGHSALLLNNLGARLRAADLTVTLLIGQLNTVKAALRQIQLWLEESSSEDSNHFQLSLDLESSLSSCGILVGLIDDRLSKLECDEKDILKFESRARIILEDARTKECLNYLGHLISSLNLLLIAFKWYLHWRFMS